MSTEEILNWMCRDMTFWYMEKENTKEIIYPITEDKQQIVQNILNENADLMIYGKVFYTINKDVAKTINKTSYIYYLKKASTYKRKKGKLILPYDIKDDNIVMINKLLLYYKNNNIPYSLIIMDTLIYINDSIKMILNPFSYINVSLGKLVIHKDIIIDINSNSVILITAETTEKLFQKRLKIKANIESKTIRQKPIKIIDENNCAFEYLRKTLLPT